MKITLTRKEFYEALLKQQSDLENYELCIKIRDTIKDATDDELNESIEVDIDEINPEL